MASSSTRILGTVPAKDESVQVTAHSAQLHRPQHERAALHYARLPCVCVCARVRVWDANGATQQRTRN